MTSARLLLALALAAALPLPAAEPDNQPAPNPEAGKPQPKLVRTAGTVTIAGAPVPYAAETATLVLETDDGKPRATVFHVSYLRGDVDDPGARPVLFAFNGGPGSSAIWLHLGALGPKRLDLPRDGTAPPPPPARLVDNADSILDAADLVFIDPVSTGYSRVVGEAKPGDFHGVDGDIESVGDFIRRWITEHDRWRSPKFLLGESYGGIRAAGLASHLQRRFGMSLNGVVLLSALLDFRTLDPSPGDDLCHLAYLPAFAAIARHHGLTSGDPAALHAAAREFAFGPYAAALLQGNALPDAERHAVATRYAELTGLPLPLVLGSNLRIGPDRFRAELLRDQGLVLGRFDARVTRPTARPADPEPGGDPSFDFVFGPFATAMLDYLRSSLGWTAGQPYEIFGRIGRWDWNVSNGHLNFSDKLVDALAANPHLRILVQCGHADLATPAPGIEYSLRHLNLPPTLQPAVTFRHYDAGHMFYLNPPDRARMHADLAAFIRGTTG